MLACLVDRVEDELYVDLSMCKGLNQVVIYFISSEKMMHLDMLQVT